ncbi:hypothetical protein N8Z47_00600 [Salibacteraceae bacterium]|nr:hypothetical protein [Salibacteraceae bacterium]
MKIRIKDNSVRLRLTQDEVKKFELSKEVKAHTSFINGTMLTYKLVWRNDEMFQAQFESNVIEIGVPMTAGKNWLDPTKVGMEERLNLSSGDELRILVEKDFACLTERLDEDESGNFPNPLSNC